GLTQGDWILVDGGDVIVHLFRPEVRAFYALEKMWSGDETESLVKPLIMAASAGVGPAASEAMA
ncbi:MAG: RsfS/YbeB/iojap family protein, partial [Rhodospirillales bacterium]